MKKNIVTIILAILVVITIIGGSILGVKYFDVEEDLMDKKEESNKNVIEKNEITVSYTENEIMFGNVKLIRK